MKKLSLLVAPLVTISFLTSCGCNAPTPEVKEHFVTFESFGGTHINTQRVKSGNAATPPSVVPTRGEDRFLGWFTDFDQPAYTFTEQVNEDITLYAGWDVAPDPGTTHLFKFTGTNCFINGSEEFNCNITIGAQARFEIVPGDRCTIPNDIELKKGENVSYRKENGHGYIEIANMSGDIEITASAVAIKYYTFSFNSGTCTINGEHEYKKEGIQEGTTEAFTILPDTGYVLPKTIEIPEEVKSFTTYKNGVITITNMSGDVTLSDVIAPAEKTTYSINFDGKNCKAKGGDVTTPAHFFQTTRNSEDTSNFIVTLSADAGYGLPDPSGVEILFDNVPGQPNDDYSYNQNSGVITIIKKANVLIKVAAVEPTKTYTVTWLNYDGEIVKEQKNVAEGQPPEVPNNPRRYSSNPSIEYTFERWLPAISEEVHSDQTYVATYQTHFYENTEVYMNINTLDDNKDFAFKCEAGSQLTIDWGDGTPQEQKSPGVISHTYQNVDKYNVRIFNPTTSIDASISGDNALIKELYFGENITSIGHQAFIECSSLTSVSFHQKSKLESINPGAFQNCSSLTSITIPSGVTSIGISAFSGCSSLTSINIPSGVTTISVAAFVDCKRLQTVIFNGESKLEIINVVAFSGCSSLTSINIPSGVTTIYDQAFWGCSSLTSITIPSGVTTIGDSAFDSCSNLKIVDLTALNTIPSLGSSVFNSCDEDLLLYVKENKVTDFKNADGWKDYATIIVPGPVPTMNTI